MELSGSTKITACIIKKKRKTNKIYLEKPPDRPKNIRTKNAIR